MTDAEAAVVEAPAAALRLRRLTTRDFRNLGRIDLTPPEAGLVIVGENGHGKTNLLESVYYLMLLRSVRGTRDQDVVRFGAPGFFVGAELAGARVNEITVGFERQGRRKRVRLDGVDVSRLSDALGALPAVMVSPRDVALVAGAPAERRRFLDVVLSVSSPRYLRALQRYRAALTRRNSVLRQATRGQVPDDEIAVWEPALAEHGAVLWRERAAWVSAHADRYMALCTAIGERGRATLRLTTGVSVDPDDGALADVLAAGLAAKRPLDLRRGVTHVGPHRDDLALGLDGRELRLFGSAGQQRTAAIALRLLEAETLRTEGGAAPIALLDDPFAELDARRSDRILALLGEVGLGQTLLAVPRVADIPAEYTRLERCWIRDGVLGPMGQDSAEVDAAERASMLGTHEETSS